MFCSGWRRSRGSTASARVHSDCSAWKSDLMWAQARCRARGLDRLPSPRWSGHLVEDRVLVAGSLTCWGISYLVTGGNGQVVSKMCHLAHALVLRCRLDYWLEN